jgi:hypothetical protein
MPRKQRFKPSRKPKPIETTPPTSTPQQTQAEPSSRPASLPRESASPQTTDVSSET